MKKQTSSDTVHPLSVACTWTVFRYCTQKSCKYGFALFSFEVLFLSKSSFDIYRNLFIINYLFFILNTIIHLFTSFVVKLDICSFFYKFEPLYGSMANWEAMFKHYFWATTFWCNYFSGEFWLIFYLRAKRSWLKLVTILSSSSEFIADVLSTIFICLKKLLQVHKVIYFWFGYLLFLLHLCDMAHHTFFEWILLTFYCDIFNVVVLRIAAWEIWKARFRVSRISLFWSFCSTTIDTFTFSLIADFKISLHILRNPYIKIRNFDITANTWLYVELSLIITVLNRRLLPWKF